ncbi:hypothetical protein [Metabacillus sp. Hm71]|uniref:hypothetical protein n=1 Tax=Metabacillus sp. Hm71 TaxID=3450743 RepID=UPI003F41C1ED
MKKIFCCLVLCLFIFPSLLIASEEPTEIMKAAFVKNDQLWMKIGEYEKRITNGEYVRFPKWSYDGSWLAYLKGEKSVGSSLFEGELWLYNIQQDKHVKVYSNSRRNFQWAPDKNVIGFQSAPDKKMFGHQSEDRLYITDTFSVNTIHHIGSGISNFSWLPNGEGFLTSSKTGEQIDSDIVLSKISLDQFKSEPKTHVYTIPVAKDEYFTSTSPFKWSHDQQWGAFLLVPTPSMSADSNTLCILSKDGKAFNKIDEMLNHEEWFQWAPTHSLLSNISGGIRDAIRNKQLKVFNLPNHTSEVYTPQGFVDRDLTWLDEPHIITSRSVESDWVDVEQRPLPALYKINIKTNKQTKLTFPPTKHGDFRPQYIDKRIVWIRTDRQTANVWVANSDGSNQIKWISNINLGNWYYEKWDWDEVFSLYLNKLK